MTQYYSRIDTTLNGDVYNIPFSYMKESEISVYINDEPITAWEFLNESQIKINEMPSEIPADAIVSIRRTTDITKKVVDYTNQSMLKKENLNLSQNQLLNAIQEVYDNNIQFEIDTENNILQNRTEIDAQIEANKQELLGIQSSFENEVNKTIDTVKEAAEKVNELEQAVEEAKTAAQTATSKADETQEVLTNAVTEMDSRLNSATVTMNEKLSAANTAVENATQQANLATQKAQEIIDFSPANTDLSNLTSTGEAHFLNKAQITNCILEAPNGVVEWSGITPTGSLVNNQGVVSGFSTSNYLMINKIPNVVNSFEMEFCATTGSVDLAESQVITGQEAYKNYLCPQLGVDGYSEDASGDGGGKFCVGCGVSDSEWGEWIYSINRPTANTTYWLRVVWDGTIIYFYLKTSKEAAWELQGTTQQSHVEWSSFMALGVDGASESATGNKIWTGSIDLSQSYIKINGKMWWQGNDLGFNQFRVKEGLKTLIPNGRNENGTLRNIENNVSEDLTFTISYEANARFWAAVGNNATWLRQTSWKYDNDENYIVGLSSTTKGTKSLTTMIGDMEVKNGNITSFVSYQPVQLAKEQDIDGMWVSSVYTVFTDVSYTAGQSMTYSLSDYLPKDGNIYEVVFTGKVTTGATAGDTAYMQAESSVFPATSSFVACQTPYNRSMFVVGTTIMPVGADRNITITNASAADTATLQLKLNGYRKAR